MADKKSFVMYKSWKELFRSLPAEMAGELIQAIFSYQDGEDVSFENPALSAIFQMITNKMSEDEEKYQKRVEANMQNGKKGGRPKGKQPLVTRTGKVVPEEDIDDVHYLYLIYDSYENQFKIGETKNLKNRRDNIRRPSGHLEIVDYITSDAYSCQKSEREILAKYKRYSAGGDWFDFNWDIVDEILTQWFQEKPTGFQNNPVGGKPIPKNPDTDTDNDNDNEYVNDTERENTARAKKPKPVKHRYGEYKNVLLSDDELAKLQNEYGDDLTQRMIRELSGYISSKGAKYSSHYATIRNWIRRDKERGQPRKPAAEENPFLGMLIEMEGSG